MQDDLIGLRTQPRFADLWRTPAALCLGLLALLPLVFPATSAALVNAWNGTDAYNYCFLIVPICAYLVWERRAALFTTQPRPSLLGFAALAGAGAVWLLGKLTGTVVVYEFAFVAIAQSIVVFVLGTNAARTLSFPLFYLVFLVPMGESLIGPLQVVTARSAVALLSLTGVPVRSDGLMIYLPHAAWVVADACAGVKFLVSSVALGTLLAAMFLRTWKRRALLVALSAAIPIFANGLRAYIIVAVGYVTDNAAAAELDHLLYGWVLFALVLLILVGIAVLMREPSAREAGPAARPPASDRPRIRKARWAFLIPASSSLLVILFMKAASATFVTEPALGSMPAALPMKIGGAWTEIAAADPLPPSFAGADRVWRHAYSDGSSTVHLNVAYFAFERPGSEAASSVHRFEGATWASEVAQGGQDIALAGQKVHASTVLFRYKGQSRLIWHWLWIDGRYVGSPYLAKLLQLKVKLFGGLPDAAVVSLSTDAADMGMAANVLARFADGMGTIAPGAGVK